MNTLAAWLAGSVREADRNVRMLTGGALSVEPGTPRLVPLHELGALLGGEETPVVGVGMTLVRDPGLKYLMLMTPKARDRAVAVAAGAEAANDPEMAASLLQELGNIFGSTIANRLSRLLNESVQTSIPEVVSDLAGAILASVLAALDSLDDEVLVLDVDLLAGGERTECQIYLFFHELLRRRIAGRATGDMTQQNPDHPEGGPTNG
jgi:chemotaxis protein CheY-P-specific phosphatase CheC